MEDITKNRNFSIIIMLTNVNPITVINPDSLLNPGISSNVMLFLITASVTIIDKIGKKYDTAFSIRIFCRRKRTVYNVITVQNIPGILVIYTRTEYAYFQGALFEIGSDIKLVIKAATGTAKKNIIII